MSWPLEQNVTTHQSTLNLHPFTGGGRGDRAPDHQLGARRGGRLHQTLHVPRHLHHDQEAGKAGTLFNRKSFWLLFELKKLTQILVTDLSATRDCFEMCYD